MLPVLFRILWGRTGTIMESDKAYFTRRGLEERALAAEATHDFAEKAHLELAARYEDLALAIARREYALGIDLFDAADWPSVGVPRPALASTPDQPHQSLEAAR
jgi:hypothetical protein